MQPTLAGPADMRDRDHGHWEASGLAGSQPEGAGPGGPGVVQVAGIRGAVRADADAVEPGELTVVPAHDVVGGDDARLVADDLHVGLPALALQHDLHRL